MSNELNETNEAAEAEAKKVLANTKWPVTVELQYPVEFGKSTITSLEFRRGQLGDAEDVPLDRVPTAGQLMDLAARLCGQSPKVIRKLDPDDAAEVLAIALGFITRCRGAGKTPSE